ncbi:MAG: acyltransferase [Rhizomicrobium sp.]
MDGRKYVSLDGLRGVAALAVVLYHLPGPLHALAPRGYLAVDLFFLLSGFVLAGAYEARLRAGLVPGAFLLIRLKRLWPVYAVGVVLGVFVFSLVRALCPEAGFAFPHETMAQAILTSLLFLPQFAAYGGPAFPFNAASWSLSVELFGNLAYAALARTLRAPLLAALICVGLAGVALVALKTGTLDVGVSPSNLAGGYIRFLFSFPAGIALWRLEAAGRLPTMRSPLWLAFAAAAFAFCGGGGGAARDIVTVVFLFPAILVAARGNPRSARLARAFAWAGAVSYPLYVLHPPLVVALSALASPSALPLASLAVLCGTIAAAALANRYFDRPVQALLRRPPQADAATIPARGGAD